MNPKNSLVLLRVGHSGDQRPSHPRHCFPPLDLKIIQAAFIGNGAEPVPLIDQWVDGATPQRIVRRVLALNPRTVVIKATTPYLPESMNIGGLLRRSGATRIAIGQQTMHASLEPIAGWRDAFDLAVLGDPEEAVPQMVRNPDRANGGGFLGPFLVDNPDLLPSPVFSKQEMRQYAFPFPVSRVQPKHWGYVLSSWGCPHRCAHCSHVVRKTTGDRVRHRSPERVAADILGLVAQGADAIVFEDDTFFYDLSRWEAIFRRLRAHRPPPPWIANARADELNADSVAVAHRHGAALLKVSVESGSPEIIERLGKAASGAAWFSAAREGFRLLRESGIHSVALFLIGNPGETLDDVRRSISLARELQPDYLQVQILTLYPDVSLSAPTNAPAGRSTSRCGEFHYRAPTRTFGRIAPGELTSVQSRFYRQFYLRPAYVSRHLRAFWRFYFTLDPGLWRVAKALTWILTGWPLRRRRRRSSFDLSRRIEAADMNRP